MHLCYQGNVRSNERSFLLSSKWLVELSMPVIASLEQYYDFSKIGFERIQRKYFYERFYV